MDLYREYFYGFLGNGLDFYNILYCEEYIEEEKSIKKVN